jgi:hypothetical protein
VGSTPGKGHLWRKSSVSAADACVEVAFVEGGEVLVRHSKSPNGSVLRFTSVEWEAFVGGVRLGELDR